MTVPNKLIMANRELVQLNQENGQIIGYGFASETSPRGEQIQRFVMFTRDLKNQSFPRRTITMGRPDAGTVWSNVASVGDFINKAHDTFVPGRDTYIICYCYHFNGDPVDVLHLPDVTDDNVFPSATGSEFQGYWGVTPILTSSVGDDVVGFLFIKAPDTTKTVEYWALGPRYQAADRMNTTTVGRVPETMDGTQFAKLVDGTLWTAGGSFVVAACRQYDRVPEPRQ